MYEMILDGISKTAEQAITENADDYRNADGLLYCGKCRTAKECVIELFGKTKTVRCICKCEKERDDAEKARFNAMQEQIRIRQLRSVGITDKKILAYTFKNDDGNNPQISDLARRYVERFGEMKANNCGLLLHGDTGTGKSFYAGCIGNALIDKGVSVFATSVPRLLNLIFDTANKSALLRDICSYDLVIIDDIGAERATEYAIEQLYTIIDERYKSNKPVICTTNIEPQAFSNAPDIQRKRIYDRILEMCTPVEVKGQRRKAAGQAKAKMLNDLLYGN